MFSKADRAQPPVDSLVDRGWRFSVWIFSGAEMAWAWVGRRRGVGGGIGGRTMSDSSDPMRSCSFLSNIINRLIINTISSLTKRKKRAVGTDLSINSANLLPICSFEHITPCKFRECFNIPLRRFQHTF